MAVPKKRTSKTKKNLRKSVWKKKTESQANKALSVGKSLLQKSSSGGSFSSTQGQGFSKKGTNPRSSPLVETE